MKNITLIIVVMFFCCKSVLALHIFGGSIRYESLGNDEYRVEMELYRDCFSGGAAFDQAAIFTVFVNPSSPSLYQSLQIPLDSFEVISVEDFPICGLGNTCFEVGYYSFTLSLPYSASDYLVAYQRCCRSPTLSNIINPSEIGTTLFATISSEGMLGQNSNPRFNNLILRSTKGNTPFTFDNSAFDTDGDSLVYDLVSPYMGATPSEPAPSTASYPPYTPIDYLPPYSLVNLMGGNDPLIVDPATGIMTATPPSSGRFLLGTRVKEYRNGVLIGEVSREFTLIVGSSVNQGIEAAGRVLVQDDTGVEVGLDAGIVLLLEQDFIGDSLVVKDTTTIGLDGTFSFPNLQSSRYFFKAIPSPNSIYFDDYIPTYYGDEAFWMASAELDLCTNSQTELKIRLIEVDGIAGVGEIAGKIAYPNGSLVAGLDLVLMSANSTPVSYTQTNLNGNFSFGGVPVGTFYLMVDQLNLEVDNSLAPSIRLTLLAPDALGLNYILHPTYLEEGLIAAISPAEGTTKFLVKTTAVAGIFSVYYELATTSDAYLEVFDIMGRLVNSQELKGQNTADFRLEVPRGQVYFVRLRTDFGQVVRRVVAP